MSGKVLIVDDDPAVRRGVAGLLRAQGFASAEAGAVEEARAALAP
ncbi:MAG: response regulator, partial [Deltaproteobacteria bacterium]|nr:response regulator [Deltaproteobacteria bacterium]